MQALVLFDFDGTLADTAFDLAQAANRLREHRNLAPLPYEELRPYASQGARGLLRAALNLRPEDEGYEKVREEFLEDYAERMYDNTRLFDGVLELLDKIQQNQQGWGIVTNKTEILTWPMVRHLQLEESCRVVVCGDTTPHSKPHPLPLLHAAEQANMPPQACIYIGDDERDIIAGKAAGMATVAAAYGYCAPQAPMQWGADSIVERSTDLWPVIENWLERF